MKSTRGNVSPDVIESKQWVLLTGATGLLGSAILKELLDAGRHVLCLVRAATPAEGRQRVKTALNLWGGAAELFFERGQLAVVRGNLLLPGLGLSPSTSQRLGEVVSSVVHTAGSTKFSLRADADLLRTNVDGARHVFELARAGRCKDWHLVSTAYVCGRCARAEETLLSTQPAFRNDYEQSKWTAEHEAQQAAVRSGAALTTYRPSVVVGDSKTGATTRFAGIHRIFRAVSLMAGAAAQPGSDRRHHIPLRIPADASARPNLMFVDDVAREFAELFSQPHARGRIFHLTHPDPPSNATIQQALEEYYDIGGGVFVGAQVVPQSERTAYEDIFFDVVCDTEPYLLESPTFDRTQTDRFVSRSPTTWNELRLRSQIHFGETSGWRRKNVHPPNTLKFHGDYGAYFERFMPEAYPRFHLASLASLHLDVRYQIGEPADGDWTCCYRGGRLTSVARTNGVAAHVTYRISVPTFWRIVSGRLAASEAFLSGDVQIAGDMERALKFGAILQEFVRQFPYGKATDGQHG